MQVMERCEEDKIHQIPSEDEDRILLAYLRMKERGEPIPVYEPDETVCDV